jgi:hypothetical protein
MMTVFLHPRQFNNYNFDALNSSYIQGLSGTSTVKPQAFGLTLSCIVEQRRQGIFVDLDSHARFDQCVCRTDQ